jgi:hypothetical protein
VVDPENDGLCARCDNRRGYHRVGDLRCPALKLNGGLSSYPYEDSPDLVFKPKNPVERIMPGVIRDMGGVNGVQYVRPRRPAAPRPGSDGGKISPRGRPVGQDKDGFRGAPPMPWEDVAVMISNLRELELNDVAAVLEAEDQERKRLLKAVQNLSGQLESMADALRRMNPEYEAMKKIVVKLQQAGVDVRSVATDPVMVEKLLGRKDIDVTTPKELKQIKETIRSLDFEDD